MRTADRDADTVARMIAEAQSVCILWAMGVTQHVMGSDTSTAISNLLLVTGNYMRPGTGAYPLRGHNNVQGASDHGAMPNFFPGYQKVDDPEIRAKFEKAWKVTLPAKPGLDNHLMIDAIHDGRAEGDVRLRRRDEPGGLQRELCRRLRLSKLDFFVMQEIFFTRDLPLCRCDSAGQSEPGKRRNLYQHRAAHSAALQVFEPLGESRPDWEIIQDIANRLGAGWNYKHPSKIYEEIAPLTPLMAGVTYERLEGYKIAAVAGGRGWHRSAAALHKDNSSFPTARRGYSPLFRGRSRPISRMRSTICT